MATEMILTLPQSLTRISALTIPLALAIFIGGCDSTVNTCRDYYGKRINIEKAATRLRIKIERQAEPAIGDGIAWGIVSDDIDKYCHVGK